MSRLRNDHRAGRIAAALSLWLMAAGSPGQSQETLPRWALESGLLVTEPEDNPVRDAFDEAFRVEAVWANAFHAVHGSPDPSLKPWQDMMREALLLNEVYGQLVNFETGSIPELVADPDGWAGSNCLTHVGVLENGAIIDNPYPDEDDIFVFLTENWLRVMFVPGGRPSASLGMVDILNPASPWLNRLLKKSGSKDVVPVAMI